MFIQLKHLFFLLIVYFFFNQLDGYCSTDCLCSVQSGNTKKVIGRGKSENKT